MDSNNWRVRRDLAEAPPARVPMRSYQQRCNKDSSLDGNSSYGNGNQQSPFNKRSANLRKPLEQGSPDKAIDEGRRLYVGNMPYEATVRDVENLFRDIRSEIEKINMSVDSMTGRNPSYCFVDFATKELAERVMEEYNGRDFMCRQLKVKPGVKQGTRGARYHRQPRNSTESISPTYNRWNKLERPQSVNTASEEGRRLFVGGLPRFKSQEETEAQIRELFESAGFQPEVVSKLVWRRESQIEEKGNDNYCFVDLKTAQEATAAIRTLNRMEKWDWHITVNHATGASGKLAERTRLFVSGLPAFPDQETAYAGVRDLFHGYEINSITKLFAPREELSQEEGNHHFCFVELKDEEQTDAAMTALDWKEMWGWQVRVKLATKSGMPKPENRLWGGSRPF